MLLIEPPTYICHFPGCHVRTSERGQIEYHHIVPKELGRWLNGEVVLSFCPTHHRMIYHPDCKKGHHSINSPSKLQILHIYPTAPEGYAVEFKDFQGNTFMELFDGDYRKKSDEPVKLFDAQKEEEERQQRIRQNREQGIGVDKYAFRDKLIKAMDS